MFIDHAENVIENDAQMYIDIWFVSVCVRSTKKPFTRRMDNEKSNVNFGALA